MTDCPDFEADEIAWAKCRAQILRDMRQARRGLKRCPFCGAHGEVVRARFGDGGFVARCTNDANTEDSCPVRPWGGPYVSRAAARAAWNQRATTRPKGSA